MMRCRAISYWLALRSSQPPAPPPPAPPPRPRPPTRPAPTLPSAGSAPSSWSCSRTWPRALQERGRDSQGVLRRC
eukprot:scaffold21268_cov60-Phaeocystis_antarctica.AAC.3